MATIAKTLELALAHHRDGRLGDAEAAYRQVLALDPRHVEALNNLGTVLQAQGQFVAAAACLERALALAPEVGVLHFNLANALRSSGDDTRAMAAYRRALILLPNFAACHNNLGQLQLEAGDRDAAQRSFEEAAGANPDYADAHYNLGAVLQDRGDLSAARACYLRAIALQPERATAHYNLGMVCEDQLDWTAARAAFQEASRISPEYVEPHCHLGAMLFAHGDDQRALEHFDRALQIDPDNAEAHYNRAVVLLGRGDYANGWPEYAWYSKCPLLANSPFDQPLWDGSPLSGRTLLITCQCGLGDTLQMARYLGEVRKRGAGKILFAAQETLHPLLADAGLGELVSPHARDLEFDVQISATELPYVFRSNDATIPAPPYLQARETLLAKWRQKLASLDGFRVGIAWQGSPTYRLDHLRSIPLHEFEPLARVEGMRLISLQRGVGCEQLPRLAGRFAVTELGADVDQEAAFLDTAAIIANLDLVIASDTAVAHLAGALGAPVWLALPRGAYWRWQRTRDTTAWYPGMRLFRQVSVGDWTGIFKEMAESLPSIVHSKQKAAR
jgi:tetratricopeptide (TPR) repeat protein